jgi:hypothetical protein
MRLNRQAAETPRQLRGEETFFGLARLMIFEIVGYSSTNEY